MDKYFNEAKSKWGNTKEYREFIEKDSKLNDIDRTKISNDFMNIFIEFGKLKDLELNDPLILSQVKKLQDYITNNYYTCSDEILYNLSDMYINSDEFKKNIDKVSGIGTANFVSNAIKNYLNGNNR